MKRVMLIATVASMLALMVALPGAALAAQGGGGHVLYVDEEVGQTYIGGAGGSDTAGQGGGGHDYQDVFNAGVLIISGGSGSGGLGDYGYGGGGGGCATFVYLDERSCGGSGGSFR